MFKAKLIENEQYYRSRRKLFFLNFIVLTIFASLSLFYAFSWQAIILLIVFFLFFSRLSSRNQKIMKAVSENQMIEIDENEIRITSTKGGTEETIPVDTADQLTLKDKYVIPQDTLKGMASESLGKPEKNFLTIRHNGRDRTFDFEVDSYYRIGQLNKVIDAWIGKGYPVVRQ